MIDIQRLTKDLDINQKQLAEILNVSNQAITSVKQGKIKFPTGWIEIISDKFNVDITDYEYNPPPGHSHDTAIQRSPDFKNIPLINYFAYGSYTENWGDSTYIENLDHIPAVVPEDGNYLYFEVRGDSMTNDTSETVNERDYLLCRELYKHHWGSLQLKRQKLWVIVHKYNGIMVKNITKQSGHVITCHSYNELYPDFDLLLSEVVQLFYVKQIQRNV